VASLVEDLAFDVKWIPFSLLDLIDFCDFLMLSIDWVELEILMIGVQQLS
jgi:hypothetical protein